MPGGKVTTLYREQLPLTPAYAFTDYRSQGQTLPYVIVNLAIPPSGGLMPFNTYVALSRSRARGQIRLLRDF
jgi:ATP-dependent exoDNAse (exonuclease V) alpha subunit